eukprot:3911443-Amphidinium_carterae.2
MMKIVMLNIWLETLDTWTCICVSNKTLLLANTLRAKLVVLATWFVWYACTCPCTPRLAGQIRSY